MSLQVLEAEPPAVQKTAAASRTSLSDTARQGSLALADQIVVSGTSFAATLLVGRYAPNELGLYALAYSLVFVFLGVQQSLVSLPLTVFGSRLTGIPRQLLDGSSLVHSVLLAALGSLALGISVLVCFIAGSNLTNLLMVLAIAMPPLLLREFVRRFEFSHLRVSRALTLDCLASVLQLLGLGILATLNALTASTALLGISISALVTSLVWLGGVWPSLRFDWLSLRRDFAKHFRFGRWVLAGNQVWIANAYLLHWLLLFRLGPGGTALFAACMTLVDLSNPFMLGMSNFISPRAARAYHRAGSVGLRTVIAWSTLFVGGCMFCFCLFLTFFGVQVIDLLFKSQLKPTQTVVTLLAMAVFCLSLGMAPSEGLSAMERPRFNLFANALAMMVTIGAAVIGLEHGLVGAAAAVLAGHATATGLRTAMFWSCSNLSSMNEGST